MLGLEDCLALSQFIILYMSLNRRISVPCQIPSEVRRNDALDSSIDGRVGEDLGVLARVQEITQSQNGGFVAAKGVDKCLV